MVITRSGGTYIYIEQAPDKVIPPDNNTSQQEMAKAGDMATGDVTNAQLQDSLTNLTLLVQANNTSMSAMTIDIHEIKTDITQMKDVANESQSIKEQLHSTQGKVTKMEFKNQKLEEKLESYESRMYEKDIMFVNVPDTGRNIHRVESNSI